MKNVEVKHIHTGSSGAVYGLGFLGALVYYFQQASNLQEGLFGLIKACLWPAFLVYKVLEVLNV